MCNIAKIFYFTQIRSNRVREDQVQLLAKVLRQIRPTTKMRQVVLNSRSEHSFAKGICNIAKTIYYHQIKSNGA